MRVTSVGTGFTFTVQSRPGGTYTGTLHFTSTDTAATLPANATIGAGTFTATLGTAGTYTVTATDTLTVAYTSGITAVGVNGQLVTASPATVTASTVFYFAIRARDVNDITVPSYGGTVHFATTDGAGIVPANSTLTRGEGVFSATLNTPGTWTLTAVDTVTGSILLSLSLTVPGTIPVIATHTNYAGRSLAYSGSIRSYYW